MHGKSNSQKRCTYSAAFGGSKATLTIASICPAGRPAAAPGSIRDAREAKAMTPAELAKAANVEQEDLEAIEAGRLVPAGDFVLSLTAGRTLCGPSASPSPPSIHEMPRIQPREPQRFRGFSSVFAGARGSLTDRGERLELAFLSRFGAPAVPPAVLIPRPNQPSRRWRSDVCHRERPYGELSTSGAQGRGSPILEIACSRHKPLRAKAS
jgi:DNA-binding XRE family transcriptional regulator